MTFKQRQETEPSPRLRSEDSCPSFPSELWHTVHVVSKANVKRFIANMFLHGRTLRVPGSEGLPEEGDVGVEHPLLISLKLSLSSGDSAPKLRVDVSFKLPFGDPSPMATLLLPGIPLFQVEAHTKMRHAVLS